MPDTPPSDICPCRPDASQPVADRPRPTASGRQFRLSYAWACARRGSELQDQQIEWLTRRGECKGDVTCVTAAYTARMAQLATVYEGVQRPK